MVQLQAVTCRFHPGTTRTHLVLRADDRTCVDGTVVMSAPSDTVLGLPHAYRFVQQCDNDVLVHPPLDMAVGYTLDELLATSIGTLCIDSERTYPSADALLQPLLLRTDDDDETPGYAYPHVDDLLQPLSLRYTRCSAPRTNTTAPDHTDRAAVVLFRLLWVMIVRYASAVCIAVCPRHGVGPIPTNSIKHSERAPDLLHVCRCHGIGMGRYQRTNRARTLLATELLFRPRREWQEQVIEGDGVGLPVRTQVLQCWCIDFLRYPVTLLHHLLCLLTHRQMVLHRGKQRITHAGTDTELNGHNMSNAYQLVQVSADGEPRLALSVSLRFPPKRNAGISRALSIG